MKTQTDIEIVRNIRRVMVRHWIDLGRLSVRSQAGRVTVSGILLRIGGVHEPLTTPIVEAMFRQIKRIRNVSYVSVNLENWTNKGGMWRAVEGAFKEEKTIVRKDLSASAQNAKNFVMRSRTPSSDR